ncbi:MAG: sigma-54 dependent transcriptional regulator, partial [Myxococcota bacterium]
MPSGLSNTPIKSLVGKSPALCQLRSSIARVAPTDATVIILGETGTGKEVVARALHDHSECKGSFVAVNCSAIPETLAESQFFGHVAGSFTGAATDHRGYFQQAHTGTLFLDELGELPLRLQAKLLRVLEDHRVTPLGGVNSEPVEVRVVAATNRELEQAMARDDFRGDLYARLAEITLRTPALRERREDILPLLAHALGERKPAITPDLANALLLHPWRYNVRELIKVAKQLAIYGESGRPLELALVEDRLGMYEQAGVEPDSVPGMPAAKGYGAAARPTKNRDSAIPSRTELLSLVKETRGNVAELSRALGRSRRQVYRYLDRYDIDIEQYRQSAELGDSPS